MPPSKKKTYTIKYNNIVSDKGAKTQLKITKTTHTTLGCVGDLTTASKKLTVKLVDNKNNDDINDILHDEDVNRFVKSYLREQAKSSAKHKLSSLYENIYNPPQPETPQPQSHADEPTSSIEKSAFESYINDVVIKDIKGDGYEGIRALLYANDILEKEKKTCQCSKFQLIYIVG